MGIPKQKRGLERQGKTMYAYWVKYRNNAYGEEKGIQIPACNKEQAYDKAVYELIPQREGSLPYSAWVESVTYNNGNWHHFNTCEGNPY